MNVVEVIYFPKLCRLCKGVLRRIRVDGIRRWWCESCIDKGVDPYQPRKS